MGLFEWLVRAMVLAALVGLGASAVDDVLRGVRRATRLLWAVALLTSVALPLTALLAPEWWPDSLLRWSQLSDVRLVDELLATGIPAESVPVADVVTMPRWTAVDMVVAFWLVMTCVLGLRWLHGWYRLRTLRPGWREAVCAGEPVLLSDRFGPAVVGLVRPRVVIPSWLLCGSAHQQRMIVRHEVEHTRAGDQWLLAFAPVLIVLFPWNPALWWQLRRLRLAIELDCDARVLRAGVSALEYGSMLLEVAGGRTVGPPILAALAEPRTLLERRIRAMTPTRNRHALLRAASFAALAVLALTAAVLIGAPSAEQVVAQQPSIPVVQQESSPLIVVDGKPLAPAAKLELGDREIDDIEVLGPSEAVKRFGQRARLGAVLISTRVTRHVTQADTPRRVHEDEQRKAELEHVAAVRERVSQEIDAAGPRGTVMGQVLIGETGKPAVGAQVMIGRRGAITNSEGNYVITNVPAGERALEVHMPGYIGRQQIVVPENASTIVGAIGVRAMTSSERHRFEQAREIQAVTEARRVDEERIVAEQAQRIRIREAATADELEKVGLPHKVRVRDLESVGARPLLIIDGVIIGVADKKLDELDPESIDRIEVIKGAAAVALYGERGANGVISITMKKR